MQMPTGNIGLNALLFYRKVPGHETPETGYLDIPGTVALWHVIFGFVFKGHAFGMPLDLGGGIYLPFMYISIHSSSS